MAALILLFSAPGLYESTHLSSLAAPEVWSHLRTGTWIVENRAIPRTGLFSQYPNLPWNDSSWGFNFLLGMAYKLFDLRAIPILLMLMKTALAVVTFLLARSGRAGFWQAVVLSAIAQYVIRLQPLPYVFSLLFFTAELQLLVSSRHAGSVRRLFWLPLLFVVWANLHIQFVAGLALLGVFLISLFMEHWLKTLDVTWLSGRILPLSLKQVIAIAVVSVLATTVTPYGYHGLGAFKSLYSDVAFEHFAQLSSIGFRRPEDYALLMLVMAAFLALGRRRSLEVFEILMLLVGTAVAFRIQRDAWLVVLPAVAVLSRASFLERRQTGSLPAKALRWQWGVVAGGTALVLILASARLPDRNSLINRVSATFPMKACDYILTNKLPAPLFNEYSWGSFLTWYLPQYPVVIDGRAELYGADTLEKYFNIAGGKERLDVDPMVAHAGTLLLDRNSAMAKALRNLPALRSQYRLMYSDDLANVFVPAVSSEQ